MSTKLCTFPGCTNPAKSRDICHSHYSQWHRGLELRPIRPQRPVVNGRKQCKTCLVWKPVDEFYKTSHPVTNPNAHGLQAECKACMYCRVKRNKARRKAAVGTG